MARPLLARIAALRDVRPLVVLGLVAIGAAGFVIRYAAVLRYPAPPGADGGYYLTNLHAFLGNDVAGDGLGYPFVFLAYLWGITSLLGELPGLQVSGPLLAGILAVPSYVFLRTFVDAHLALIGAAILTLSETSSEMIGWGGAPTLLGMIFGLLFLAFLARWMSAGDRKHLVASAGFFGLLAGTHPFTLACFAFTAILAVAGLGLSRRTRASARRGGIGLIGGLLGSLPFFPFYARLAFDSPRLVPSQPIPMTLGDLGFIFGYLFREAIPFWALLVPAAAVGVVALTKRDRIAGAIGLSLLVSPVILTTTVFVLHPIRPFLYLPVGIVLGVLALLDRKGTPRADRRPRPSYLVPHAVGAATLLLAVVLVLVPAASRRMVEAGDWYSVVPEDGLEAFDWIRSNVPEYLAVGTTGPAKYGSDDMVGWLWGWWIEGYAQRRSLSTAEPLSLVWRGQITRSEDANRAFMGQYALENGFLLLGDTAPYGSLGNPMIAGATRYGYDYEPLLSFSDARVDVTWRDGDEGSRTVPIADLPVREATSSQEERIARIETRASTEGLVAFRTTELEEGSRAARVNYSFEASGMIEEITISVFPTSRSAFGSFDVSALALPIRGSSYPPRAGAELRVHETTATCLAATQTTGPEGRPGVALRFAANRSEARVSLLVEVMDSAPSRPDRVRVFHARSLFETYGVQYVLLDKERERELEWFSRDRGHYRAVFENPSVAIFELFG
ncbi:MAG: hypothetical protein ACT4OI_07295 [Methanobacteriota archaeon]